jgi:hypothetical protein
MHFSAFVEYVIAKPDEKHSMAFLKSPQDAKAQPHSLQTNTMTRSGISIGSGRNSID